MLRVNIRYSGPGWPAKQELSERTWPLLFCDADCRINCGVWVLGEVT